MSEFSLATNNQDDPLPVRLRRFYQKLKIISLIMLLFAFPIKVIAEDYQPVYNNNEFLFPPISDKKENLLVSVQGNALVEFNNPETIKREKRLTLSKKSTRQQNLSLKKWVLVTAYSSTVDQCDSTPFITASGIHVHNGTVAANFLRFGTKIKFPVLFGDKIFIVEDRMKNNHKISQ